MQILTFDKGPVMDTCIQVYSGIHLPRLLLLPEHTVAPKLQCEQIRWRRPDFEAAVHMQAQPYSFGWLLGSQA